MKDQLRNRLKHWIKGNLRDLYWKIHGNKVKNPGLPDIPRSFLFVCKGNVCRSPFAEQLARKIAEKENYKNMTFFSAGLEVKNPNSPPEEAYIQQKNLGCFLIITCQEDLLMKCSIHLM